MSPVLFVLPSLSVMSSSLLAIIFTTSAPPVASAPDSRPRTFSSRFSVLGVSVTAGAPCAVVVRTRGGAVASGFVACPRASVMAFSKAPFVLLGIAPPCRLLDFWQSALRRSIRVEFEESRRSRQSLSLLGTLVFLGGRLDGAPRVDCRLQREHWAGI